MMKNTKYTSLKLIIGIHEERPVGPGFVLKNYLIKKRVNKLMFISHPLLYFSDSYKNSSRYELYEKGFLSSMITARHFSLAMPILFMKDFLYTIWWSTRLKGKYDVFFGVDPLNVLAGIVLKKIGKVKKIVYYNIDYTPARFDNVFINKIYHLVDTFACYNVDINWIGTKRTELARIQNGLLKEKMAKTVIVPDGNNSKSISKKKDRKIKMNRLVYLGSLDKKQGLDLVLEALPLILKKIPNIELVIMGKGDYEGSLKKKAKLFKLNCVKFMGFIQSEDDVENILLESAVALAPYVPDKNSFTYYSEAGKPKYYLGCGVPIVITDVPEIARDIQKYNAGEMIRYKKEDLANAVLKILNKKNYSTYKANAVKLGKTFDSNTIFSKALSSTL